MTPGYYENTGFTMTDNEAKNTEKQEALGVQVEPFVSFLLKSSITSFGENKSFPLYKSILHDYFYPILWIRFIFIRAYCATLGHEYKDDRQYLLKRRVCTRCKKEQCLMPKHGSKTRGWVDS